jgi:hypothetical protein
LRDPQKASFPSSSLGTELYLGSSTSRAWHHVECADSWFVGGEAELRKTACVPKLELGNEGHLGTRVDWIPGALRQAGVDDAPWALSRICE